MVSAAVSIFTFIVDASVEGNPNLASVGGKKKNIVVPVVAAAGGFVILLLCGLALLWHLKRRKKG